jgi:hypothetical protein
MWFFHYVMNSFFGFGDQFCKQTDGIAVGLLLSPANFFMEDFEEVAPNWATHKSLCWFHYVDDIFVIRPHGFDMPKDVLTT